MPLKPTDTRSSECLAESQSFQQAKDLFDLQSSSWFEEFARKHVRTYVSIWTDVITSVEFSSVFLTLDDGYPRLKSKFAVKTDINVNTYPYTGEEWPIYTGIYPEYPDCLRARESAREASIRKLQCGGCTIHGDEVQLNYWPVNTASIRLNRTITPGALNLATAVVNGATFTSPTVYLSIERAYAMDACSNKIGKEYPGAIIGLKPDALSSFEGYESRTIRPVNYEELYENLPASRWFELEGCQPYGPRITQDCLPIRSGRWPTLVVPEQIRNLDPDWKSCNLTLAGLYDPPRILVPAHVLVSPTATADADFTTHTAVAAPAIQPQEPAITARPKPGTLEPLNGPPVTNPSAEDQDAAKPLASDTPLGDSAPKRPSVIDPLASNSPAINVPIERPPAKDPPTKTWKPGNLPAPQQPESPHMFHHSDDLPPDSTAAAQVQVIRHVAIITLGPQIYTVDSATHVVIGSTTLSAGGAAATVLGEVVSLSAKGVIVGGEVHTFSAITYVIGPASSKTLPVKLYIADDKHVVAFGSAILSPGEVATIAGEVISVGNNGVVLGGETKAFSAFQTLGPFPKKVYGPKIHAFISAQPLETNGADASPLIVDGKTLSPAGVFVFTPVPNTQLPTIVVESRTLTVNSAGLFIFNSPTLTPENLILASGRVIFLDPTAFPMPTAQTTTLPAITFGSKIYTADSAGRYVINGQTLSAGSSITISGTIISAPFDPTPTPALPTITIGSQTYTANSAGQYNIAGKTLTSGGGINVSGTPISLSPSATAIVIGSSTVALAPASVSPTGLGSLIMQGFAPYSAPSSNYTGQAFLGSARRTREMPRWLATGILGFLPWLINAGV